MLHTRNQRMFDNTNVNNLVSIANFLEQVKTWDKIDGFEFRNVSFTLLSVGKANQRVVGDVEVHDDVAVYMSRNGAVKIPLTDFFNIHTAKGEPAMKIVENEGEMNFELPKFFTVMRVKDRAWTVELPEEKKKTISKERLVNQLPKEQRKAVSLREKEYGVASVTVDVDKHKKDYPEAVGKIDLHKQQNVFTVTYAVKGDNDCLNKKRKTVTASSREEAEQMVKNEGHRVIEIY